MKEKQGNKPNSYGKLMKRMLIYLGIGGVCGFFVGIFMTFGVKNGMSDLSDLVRPLALPIIAVIFVVSIVLMEFYSRKLKDTMKHLEEAEDEQYEVLTTAFMVRKAPFKLVSSTWSQASSFIVMSRPSRVMPALLTRMWTAPNCCRAASTRALTSSVLDTSQRMAAALAPRASQAATVSRAACSLPA